MEDEKGKTVKVDVLLEHVEGENGWTASVPLIDYCMAVGDTADKAQGAIVPEIQYFIKQDPDGKLMKRLQTSTEHRLISVDITLNLFDPSKLNA